MRQQSLQRGSATSVHELAGGPPSSTAAPAARALAQWLEPGTARPYVRQISNVCICGCMPSRNIAVQKAVYDALEREKRTGESFTSVLRRLLAQRRGLEELAGAWGSRASRGDRDRLRALRSGGRR